MGDRMYRAIKPDAQAFDEVRIVTVPRYKESELSGDEWRISARIEFWRKGKVVHSCLSRNVHTACSHVGYRHDEATDDAKGYFAGEGDVCDQEGCSNPATVYLRLKKGYERNSGAERQLSHRGEYRCFCVRHQTRGDCGLEDADSNYEPITREMAEGSPS